MKLQMLIISFYKNAKQVHFDLWSQTFVPWIVLMQFLEFTFASVHLFHWGRKKTRVPVFV